MVIGPILLSDKNVRFKKRSRFHINAKNKYTSFQAILLDKLKLLTLFSYVRTGELGHGTQRRPEIIDDFGIYQRTVGNKINELISEGPDTRPTAYTPLVYYYLVLLSWF